jgi:hypothetical protein
MFTLWQEFADGSGGSYMQSQGAQASDQFTSCWYPNYYYTNNEGGENYVYWNACGNDGNFGPTGNWYNWTYSNGDGNTTSDSGSSDYNPPYAGDVIYNGGCCMVYYDGNNGYYSDDTCNPCPDSGQYTGQVCINTNGTDARGTYFDGAWQYGNQYTDGSCGYYVNYEGTNGYGCYYPAGWYNSYYTSDNGSNTWYVEDSNANQMASGTYQYSYNWNAYIADGYGNSNQSMGSVYSSYGDLFADGTYYDYPLDQNWYYAIYSDGSSGYYVSKSPI